MARGSHPRSAALLKWLIRQREFAQPFEAELYRVAGPRHTTAHDLVSGIGAFLAGGRWNPPGEMNVVYLSQEPETATKEALEHFRYYGLPISHALPKVMVAVRVKIEQLLDLTNVTHVTGMPMSLAELMAEDWRALMSRNVESSSQAVGWAAHAAGFQGLKVPSKPDPDGTNVLIFPESLTRNSRLEVINADELDRLGRPM